MQGKTAIVTGGASGIGRSSGERLARRGATRTVADRNAAAAQPFAGGIRAADDQAVAIAAAGILFDPGAA